MFVRPFILGIICFGSWIIVVSVDSVDTLLLQKSTRCHDKKH